MVYHFLSSTNQMKIHIFKAQAGRFQSLDLAPAHDQLPLGAGAADPAALQQWRFGPRDAWRGGYQPMAVLNVLKGEGFLCHGQVIDYALHPYLGMRRNNSICHGDLHIHICICMYIYIFYLFIHAYAPTVRIPVMGCRGKKQGPWLITMLPIKHVFFEWYTVVYGYMVYSILRHTHMKHGILLHVENHKSTGWRQF
jgi:hypothetical protein